MGLYNESLNQNIDNLQVNRKLGNGGGGSTSKYSETVLYDYREDNGGIISYDNTTHTLRDTIDNYDELWFEFAGSAQDMTSTVWNSSTLYSVNVNLLKNAFTPYYFNFTSYERRSSRIHIEGNEFTTVKSNEPNTNGLIKIIGVKYKE